MRQNEFGEAPRATRIAARTAAGCVTATVCDVSSVSDAIQAATRSIRSTIGFTAVRRPNRVGQPHVQVSGRDTLQRAPTPSSAIQIGQPRLRDRPQTQQLRGLPSPPLGRGELACTAFDFEAHRGLLAAAVVEWLVGRKPRGRHGVGHRVRHHGQPDDPGHAVIPDARPVPVRSTSSRPASAAKTRPMVTPAPVGYPEKPT